MKYLTNFNIIILFMHCTLILTLSAVDRHKVILILISILVKLLSKKNCCLVKNFKKTQGSS